MDTGRGLGGGTNGLDTGAMAGNARQVPPFGPASVAIHNDGYVVR
jgi:hypothetical protein